MGVPQNPGADKLYVTPITPDGIFVRSGPGTQHDPSGSVFPGDALEVLDPAAQSIPKIGQSGAWIKIRTAKGIIGWVGSRFVQRAYVRPVSPTTPSERDSSVPSGPKLYVTPAPSYVKGIYIRSGQGKQFDSVAEAMPGDRLEAPGEAAAIRRRIGKNGEWIQVKTAGGVLGWVAAWVVEEYIVFHKSPVGHALVGLHGPAEPWPDRWTEDAYRIIRKGRIEAVKLLAANLGDNFKEAYRVGTNSIIDRLHAENVKFIMARLFAKFPEKRSAQSFVDEVNPAIEVYFAKKVRYFEVHNEPNLHTPDAPEGMWVMWKDGAEFADFFAESYRLLKARWKDAYFGFPGVSPGWDIPNVRAASDPFLAQAAKALQMADFICMHTYWGADGTPFQESIKKVRDFCKQFPDKSIFVSEFSNPGAAEGKDAKAWQYLQFLSEARNLPANLGGLFSFVLSAFADQHRRDFPHETWLDAPIIAETVGSRQG